MNLYVRSEEKLANPSPKVENPLSYIVWNQRKLAEVVDYLFPQGVKPEGTSNPQGIQARGPPENSNFSMRWPKQ